MLKAVIGIAAGAALMLAAGSRPAQAMADDVVVKAQIPFAFEVNGRTMPAGQYEIESQGIYEQSVLEIRNTNGQGPTELVLSNPQKAHPDVRQAKMVFDEVGGQRFLRSILVPGVTGAHLSTGREELKAVRAEDGIPAACQN